MATTRNELEEKKKKTTMVKMFMTMMMMGKSVTNSINCLFAHLHISNTVSSISFYVLLEIVLVFWLPYSYWMALPAQKQRIRLRVIPKNVYFYDAFIGKIHVLSNAFETQSK